MTSAALLLSSCPDCADELDHCHGTVVVHVALEVECGEPGCAGDPARHVWQVPCADTGCTCEDDALGAVPEPLVHPAWAQAGAPDLGDLLEPGGGQVRAA